MTDNEWAACSNNELLTLMNYGKNASICQRAAAELRRREQAQHSPESGSASAAVLDGVAEAIDKAFALTGELAAENERLRGLLAKLINASSSPLAMLIARFQNDYLAGGMDEEDALTVAHGITAIVDLQAAIEAAKEATNAQK